jgi:phenylacetate-CoA ligase
MQKNTFKEKIDRPWGSYQILYEGRGFKTKLIEVNPAQQLSLQLHKRRSEHWVVVSGEALIVNHNQEYILTKNQSTYIPIGHKHKISNFSYEEKLVILEVQCGDYLEEDDIVRFEDIYGRTITHNNSEKTIIENISFFKKNNEKIIFFKPVKKIKGFLSAFIAYPISEKYEKRRITPKVKELKDYYKKNLDDRLALAQEKLFNILLFAGSNVPYYKDLFKKTLFNPEKIKNDIKYIQDIPFLTKDIIREQKDRLLSRPLNEVKHYICKTGGSTGPSAIIYYDQESSDYSAAITLFARECIGKFKWHDSVNFACNFPNEKSQKFLTREDFKCFALNRTNIFLSRLDDIGIREALTSLRQRKPFLVHAHPSTMHALAMDVIRNGATEKLFEIFESSGEMLETYMADNIQKAFKCKIINRYGLAEFGIIAYQMNRQSKLMQILESEGWPENNLSDNGKNELVFTGFRNYLMPLIRYTTGDESDLEKKIDGFYLKNIIGRMHDLIPINGIQHSTNYIMDVLDHKIGGIQEFQIDARCNPPKLRIVLEALSDKDIISKKLFEIWPHEFIIEFIDRADLILIGQRAKFRHIIN